MPPVSTQFALDLPGDWFLEDDGIPGNNISRLRAPDGSFIDFEHPTGDLSLLADGPGVHLTIAFTESLGAANFSVGNRANSAQTPASLVVQNVETTGRVILVSQGGIVEGADADADADIVAGGLVLIAGTGIGTPDNAIETRVAALEARTSSGGLTLTNSGDLRIGEILFDVEGVRIGSGDMILRNLGTITISDTITNRYIIESGSGNVTLIAEGYESDILSAPDIPDEPGIRLFDGDLLLRAGRDIVLGISGGGDIEVVGEVRMQAGRDVSLLPYAFLSSGSMSAGVPGLLEINAGRDINISNFSFAVGEIRLTTGLGGALTFGGDFSLFSYANITANADRILISPDFDIQSGGTVTLAPVEPGRPINIGSTSDSAFALELSDAELDRVIAPQLNIGSLEAGRVTLTGLVGPQNVLDVAFRSGQNIELRGLFLVGGDLRLEARDHVLEFASSGVGGDTLTVLVDTPDDDAGVGGNALLVNSIGNNGFTITGNLDHDALNGTGAVNRLFGLGGRDVLRGFGGNDLLDGGSAADTMFGGAGDDTFIVDDIGDAVAEAAAEGLDTVFTSISYRLEGNVERLGVNGFDTTFAINLGGNALDNELWGNDGPNMIDGDLGGDIMNGNGGDDIFFVDNANDVVVETFGDGVDLVYTSVDHVLRANVERLGVNGFTTTYAINLTGNILDNEMWGNDGVNILNGGIGDDIMNGFGGNDVFFVDSGGDIVNETPGNGMDTVFTSITYTLGANVERLGVNGFATTFAISLTGNILDNEMWGNDGVNTIDGREGTDILHGNAGADTFAFSTALGPTNVDLVTGFIAGLDRIGLDDAVFAGLPPGGLAADAFTTGSSAQDAADRIIYNPTTGALFFDADGNGAGAAVQFATLPSGIALSASDFVIF